MIELPKKLIAAIVILSLFVNPFFVNRAKAQIYVPTNDIPLNRKEGSLLGGIGGLDSLAWFAVNAALERMASSVVDWINNGFQGKPAFLTDPESYFKKLGDGIAGEVIYNHPDFGFMCSPFKVQVQIALQKSYTQPRQFQCTLGQIANNWDNFMDDFTVGGWEGFVEVTQNSTNNPLGFYVEWQDQLNRSQAQERQLKQKELDQGRGFLSFESCDEKGLPVTRTVVESGHFEPQPDGTNRFVPGRTQEIREEQCKKSSTKTPGSVIETQLNSVLGSGQKRLETADEINEIISALMNQLMNKALGGLSSLTKKKPGEAGQGNYLDKLSTATEKELRLITIPLKVPPTINNYTMTPQEACPRGLCLCPSQPVAYTLSGPPDEPPGEWWCRANECPDGYTKDVATESPQCISTEKIQANIEQEKAQSRPTDTSRFGDMGTSTGSGAGTGGRTPPPPQGSVPSNPICGPAARTYPSTALGLEGDLCGPNAMLVGGPTGTFATQIQWTCGYPLTGSYAACSAGYDSQ